MTPTKIPLKADFFTSPLEPLDKVRLQGTRCRACGTSFLGKIIACENCQSTDLEDVVLSNKGTLYSYTVIRNRPPGDYKGQDNPFVPFGAGLVELPDGLLILSRLVQCDIEKLKVGMKVEMVVEPLYQDEQGNDVLMFAFKPVKGDK